MPTKSTPKKAIQRIEAEGEPERLLITLPPAVAIALLRDADKQGTTGYKLAAKIIAERYAKK